MQSHSNKKHTIDLLFPIALFFVLAVSSLIVVLLASNIYKNTTQMEQANYESRTSLSYVAGKIRQNDEHGAVSLGSFDGIDALVLSQNYDGQSYKTYIYEYEGSLRELFIRDNVSAKASDGQAIMDVQDFKIEAIGDQIFQLSCIDTHGQKISTIAAVKSEP